MNSCVLMAKIVKDPELRYTQETQQAFAKMLVEFRSQQQNQEQISTLTVTAWGNLATEVQKNYHLGDQVILVGRLGMNVVTSQDGTKEKRAELTITNLYPAGSNQNTESDFKESDSKESYSSTSEKAAKSDKIESNGAPRATVAVESSSPAQEAKLDLDNDDIPF